MDRWRSVREDLHSGPRFDSETGRRLVRFNTETGYPIYISPEWSSASSRDVPSIFSLNQDNLSLRSELVVADDLVSPAAQGGLSSSDDITMVSSLLFMSQANPGLASPLVLDPSALVSPRHSLLPSSDFSVDLNVNDVATQKSLQVSTEIALLQATNREQHLEHVRVSAQFAQLKDMNVAQAELLESSDAAHQASEQTAAAKYAALAAEYDYYIHPYLSLVKPLPSTQPEWSLSYLDKPDSLITFVVTPPPALPSGVVASTPANEL